MAQAEKISAVDRIKWVTMSGLLAVSTVLFYYFSEVSFLFRVLGLVAAFVVAASIFFTTEKGKFAADFLQAARLELRKMIWPTKTETLQTTLIVFVAVIVVAIFLWMVDLFLSWFMGLVIY